MKGFGRLLFCLFAGAFAIACAIIFLPVAVLFDPVIRAAAGDLTIAAIVEMFDVIMDTAAPETAAARLFNGIWLVIMGICVVPTVLTALIGELARVRAYAWYAGTNGILAAAMPWIARSARGTTAADGGQYSSAEMHFALVFFLTGVLAGTIYWLLAGRRSPNDPRMSG